MGLDTNIFIRIYDQPYLLDREASRIFNQKDLLFTHAACAFEFAKYISKKEKITLEDAKKEAKSFLRKRNVTIIYPKQCSIKNEEVSKFETFVNSKIKEKDLEGFRECHYPDSLILLAFKKCNVNKIYSTDSSFLFAAELLGIDGSGIPTFNKKINNWFRKNPKFSKKRKTKRR